MKVAIRLVGEKEERFKKNTGNSYACMIMKAHTEQLQLCIPIENGCFPWRPKHDAKLSNKSLSP